MCDNSSYRTIPLEPVPPGAYNATTATSMTDRQGDVSRPYAAEDYAYQAYISSTSEPTTTSDGNGYPAPSYGYYATLSKYAPEEPALFTGDSFSGYAPAPPTVHVPYSVPTETTYTVGNQQSHGDVDMRENNAVLCATKTDSSSSQLDCSRLSSRSQSSMDEDSNDGMKNSTAKKIKSLPLPKVGLPPRQPKSKSEQFKEYVGEVARLNEEIERLQKLQEQLRQEAKKIARTAADDDLPQEELLDESTSLLDGTGSKSTRKQSSAREVPAVAEYIPTPLAELERMKREEKKKKKKKEKEYEPSFEEVKEKVKAGPSKRRLLSEDEISTLFEDKPEPKRKKVKEAVPSTTKKERSHTRRDSISPSKSPDVSAKSEPPPKLSKKEEKSKSVKVSEGAETSSSTISDSADDVKETSPEIVGATKKRIAREGVQDRALKMATAVSRRVPSASEQLQARMASLAKEKSISPTFSSAKPITLEQMYGHRRPNVVGSIAKGESRTARTSLVSSSQAVATPKLRDPTNSKIPFSLRVNFLNKIFSQYLEVCPEVEAVRNSEIEEKAILDKVRHAQGYKVAAINLIGRIRNAKSTGLSKPRAALSHDAVLAGRHVNDISIRVRKSEKQSVGSLTEKEFYNILIEKYLMTEEQLIRNGYPRAVEGEEQLVTIAPTHFEKSKSQKSWAEKDDLERLCSRCHKEFRLDPKGNVVTAECIYHFKGLQRRGGMRGESYFSCCGADRNTPGCCVAEAHVSDTLNAEALREFCPTPPSRGEDDPRNEKVYAMDCEMVYGVWGPELARVSVVDMDNKLVLDLIVKPHNRVIDYNTRFSGLTANQVEASTIDLFEAQNRLFELVNDQSILIGHSLESDLKAMRLRHEKVVDTAVVYEHRQGFPFKRALRNLASEYLQKIIQEDDSGHDSQEDAATCMSLMLLKAKEDCK
uniref:Exonuclease domain-containing protein n=1 Tax=Haemonchus contortus TaxID=6289 RepID=A0A7I4Y181_HAECO